MPRFPLENYLAQFPRVCQAKFGRTYDLGWLEKQFEELSRGTRWLAARDVSKIFDPAATPFGRYWPKPSEKDLDAILKQQRIRLGPASIDRSQLVTQLLNVFRSTGLVSVLLRLTHPAQFGIISSPVLNLTQVYRASSADLYLAYCDELRHWQRHCQMNSVAETETALWTFYQLTEGMVRDENAAASLAEFHQDVWIQRRRLGHVLKPFLKSHGRLEWARLLSDIDPSLAGKVAAEEYERLLHQAEERFYRSSNRRKDWAQALIDRLAQDEYITLQEKTTLRKIWEVRNHAVHAGEKPLRAEQVEVMIDDIQRIFSRWESSNTSAGSIV